jgi:hypothetical protein
MKHHIKETLRNRARFLLVEGGNETLSENRRASKARKEKGREQLIILRGKTIFAAWDLALKLRFGSPSKG